MSKRFTDTCIWDDVWYQEMPMKYKMFWKYLCDKCDIAGAWKINMALAEFQIGDKLDSDEALRIFNTGKNRVASYPGVWLLVEFVTFQYGILHPGKVRFHTVIKEQIDRLSHRVTSSVTHTLQDKDRDMDKDMDTNLILRGDTRGDLQSPPFAPANAPANEWTLDDCIKAAEPIAMPKVMVEDFYNTFASVGWIDTKGRRITNLTARLARWKSDQANRTGEHNGRVQSKREYPYANAGKKIRQL